MAKMHENQDKESYGQEIIIDLEDVPDEMFTEENVKKFLLALCDEIKMKHDTRGPITWGTHSDENEPGPIKSDGISGVLFIETSSITIHAIDLLNKIFVNCFSCAPFDSFAVITFTRDFWNGKVVNHKYITRI
jgi:S-adenosylmethionine/arginine decarboxylase-like enzyme